MFKRLTDYSVELDYLSSRGGSGKDQIGARCYTPGRHNGIAWARGIAVECIRRDPIQDIL